MSDARLVRARRLIALGQENFRKRLIAADRASAERLRTAYLRSLGDTIRQLDDLRRAAAQANMTTEQLAKEQTLLRFQDEFKRGLKDYTDDLESAARKAQNGGASAGMEFASTSLRGAGIGTGFRQPSVKQVRALIPYVDSKAFQAAIARFADDHVDHITNTILINAVKGIGPKQTASQIAQYAEGFPLFQARAMVRTVNLWAAREGTMAVYRENSDIVSGWIWSAELSARTCMSCIAMHGTFHGLNETLDDHYNGRCAPIPVTQSWAGLGFRNGEEVTDRIQSGVDWFKGLPDSEQRHVMGSKTMFEAWKSGAFKLEQIPRLTADPIYGAMRGARPLKDLLQ